jgi:hypothetical protein
MSLRDRFSNLFASTPGTVRSDPGVETAVAGLYANVQPRVIPTFQNGDDSSVDTTPTTISVPKDARTNPVLALPKDPPTMGVITVSSSGTVGAYVGGKPLYDWSGLDPTTIPAASPNMYRGESHKSAKDYYYRVKGLDKKIGPKDDLRETCRNVFDHLETFGLDTISYLPNPANPTIMESVAEKPNVFSKAYVLTQIPKYQALWDSYDQLNDMAATKFLLASFNDEILRKVRDALASTTKPTFIQTWMTFVEQIRVISVGRLESLQRLVELRVPTQYPGQNLETMAAHNIRDIVDLEQAGWYSLNTGNTMVRNFASANSECAAFTWFSQSFLSRHEAATTHCFHMNKNECRAYMESQGFGYETICILFADYYRKANQDGRWLPTKTVRDNHGAPRNFANQAKIKAMTLVQNGTPAGTTQGKTGNCNNCGQAGHWARECPNGSNATAVTQRTSNRSTRATATNRTTGSTPWTKVPPPPGQPQSKSMHGKTFYWCATCKRWTTSHKTSEHKSNPTTTAPGTTTNTQSNISLMATSTNFSAWHVCLDVERKDVKAKENYWLNMINSFITNFIFLPLQLVVTFGIGMMLSIATLGLMMTLVETIGYGMIAPVIWITTLLAFFYLHPIVSVVDPPEPPPLLLRWQKRKIAKWIEQQRKNGTRMAAPISNNNFHRSYPLRLRSAGQYHRRTEVHHHLDAAAAQSKRHKMIADVKRMEDKMDQYYAENVKLTAANKRLTAELAASQLYCPTPFERETETPEEKNEQIKKAVENIRDEFKIIRGGIESFIHHRPACCCSYIAQSITQMLPVNFLNQLHGYVPSCFRSDVPSKDTDSKSVIWDSGSSMSITFDRSEFVDGEYEVLPPDRTLTGISDTQVKIEGVGMVSWSFVDTKGTIRTLVLPCLYVPSIQQRLLSTSSLLKQYPKESISITKGKMVFSGTTANSIQANIDASNNLPTTKLVEPSVEAAKKKEMQTLVAVVAEANMNITEPEKELLKWHQRLAHIDCNKVKFLFRTGVLAHGEASRSLQTAASKIRTNPRCAACQFGKQCQLSVPTTTQAKVTDSVGAISKDVVRPGQQVSMDHFVCKNKGRLFTSRGKTVSTDMYSGGCLFVDNYSGFVHIELQKHLNTLETLQAKERFEAMSRDYGVIPQTYLSDNGSAFTSHEFASKMKELGQVSKFAGAGAHHHNGVAERNIRTIISIARTMMIHSAMHWPEVSDVELWPMAVKHAVHVFNRVPAIETGICPLDKFTRQRFQQSKLHDLHVWGCPVYVLDKRTADGIKIPKWAPRSNRYIYMGVSDKHSSSVPLVLNPESGVISPQFHVVVDEWFATIATSTGELPDFTKDEWTKMFGENAHHYLWDEDEEQEDLPPPQLESVERREERIVTAMDNERPAVALPVPDPPTTATQVTPHRTPTSNRFEPLSTYDDDDFEPFIIHQTPPRSILRTPLIGCESVEQRESPVREQQQQVSFEPTVEEIIVPVENTDLPIFTPPTSESTSPVPLRRSTRERRAPDRLNLYTESPSCFHIESTPYGFDAIADDAYTYLHHALCATTPAIQQASSLISADSFKASIGDPDTLSWDQAMADVENLDKWMEAALKEISSLEAHGTWIVDEQANATSKILPGTWVFRRKRAPDGTITKYKARYCVRGDLQTEYHETYAPVVSWSTIRLFLILSILLSWNTKSIDFSQAFVQATLDYPVWIHLPRGFHTSAGIKQCLKLVKSLYGLAEAPRLWYLHLFNALVNELGFTQSKIDACLLMKEGMMIVVFVDDCAISYRSEVDYHKLIADLRKLNFELTEEGDFSKFLGIDFTKKENKILMTQTGLINRIAAATGLTSSNPNHTPTQQEALGKDLEGLPMTDTWSYRSVVGMMLYLSTNTRPDIAFAVSQVARFSNFPRQSHAIAVKTIVRYLVGTQNQGTVVTPTGKLDINLFVDADFAGLFKKEAENDPDSARSRTGYILLLGGFPLIWKTNLQNKIALSTLEAEYAALSASTRALIPIRELLFEIATTIALPQSLITTIRSTVFEDNQGAFLLATTQRISTRTRYFSVEFHHFWEFIKMEDENMRKIFLEKISTEFQGADFLTKGLSKIIFQRNRSLILGW